MSADVESRLRSAYGHLVPEAACEADLASTLATALQEPAPPRVAWARRLVVPLAASLLVAGAWWWGSRESDRQESSAGPGDEAAQPPTITIRVRADGTADVTPRMPSTVYLLDQRVVLGGEAMAKLERDLGTAFEPGAALAELTAQMKAFAGRAPPSANGASSARLVIGGDATAQWRWVSWAIMAAASAEIADIVFTSPADPKITVAQPLPADASAAAPPPKGARWPVVLRTADRTECARLPTDGCFVDVSWPGAPKPSGRLVVEGSNVTFDEAPGAASGGLPEEVASQGMLENRKRTKDTLDALMVAVQSAIATRMDSSDGVVLVGEIDAPPPSCVPYGAVFEVLATLKEGGLADVRFVGSAPPRRRPQAPPAVPGKPAAPIAPAAPTPARAADAVLDEKKIRGLDFQDVPIASVATYLRVVSGLDIFVTPKATALEVKVKLKLLSDVTVRQALDFVTLPYGLRWQLRDSMIVISAHDEGAETGR